MSNIFFERYSELCNAAGKTPNSVAKEIGASSGSVTAWKNGTGPRSKTLAKIADYFNVSTDYLLSKESGGLSGTGMGEHQKTPTGSGERPVNDDDIKFALFGGDGEITDAMYQEVRNFAAFVKQREAEKKAPKE